MPRSPHAAARNHVLRSLAEAKRKVTALQRWWDVTATVYVPDPDSTNGNRIQVPRPVGEYPEAQTRYWASTVRNLDELMLELSELREYAARNARATAAASYDPAGN